MNPYHRSQSSSTATTLPSGGIGRDRSDILNSSDLESVSGESSNGRLGTGAGGLDVNSTSSSEFDVDGVDSDNGEGFADVDGGEHSSIGGRFFSISLDLHSSGNSGVSFTTGEIGDMDEGVVEGSLDVADSKVQLILVLGLRAGGSVVHGLLFFDNLWWHNIVYIR